MFVALYSNATQWIVSPIGSDANPGTLASPFYTLNNAWVSVSAGDTIYMRGGTYTYPNQVNLSGKNGSTGNLIKIWNYPGEVPIITRPVSGYTATNPSGRRGPCISGNFIHMKGIEMTGFFQDDGFIPNTPWVSASNDCIFENLKIHHNGGGLYLQYSCTRNLLLNIDSYANFDVITGGGNSDGITIALNPNNSATNTIRGCRTWYNGDDGFDVSQNTGFVIFENCWSYKNGYLDGGITASTGNGMGFKLGPPADGLGGGGSWSGIQKRTLKNCVASNNITYGFDTNVSDCIMNFYNCNAYGNNQGFHINVGNQADVYTNNLAYANNYQVFINANAITTTNAATGDEINDWTSATISNADFESIDHTLLITARNVDGSLPSITFLKIAVGSDLIDAGTNVGIPFTGTAPDIGAFESGTNTPPTANAGPDQSVTPPSCTLTGSGNDITPGGSITTYAWIKLSGPSCTITSPASAITGVTGLSIGTYIFELTVTDNGGATATDTVTITVSGVAPHKRALFLKL